MVFWWECRFVIFPGWATVMFLVECRVPFVLILNESVWGMTMAKSKRPILWPQHTGMPPKTKLQAVIQTKGLSGVLNKSSGTGFASHKQFVPHQEGLRHEVGSRVF
jgi:hypothetical protein